MTHINQRTDLAANWTSDNPVLQRGEVGWERSPSNKAKVGDGVTAWNALPYAVTPNGAVDSVNGHVGVVVLDKWDVGLGDVNNTADGDKPISVAVQAALDDVNDAMDLLAPLAGPDFSGNPRVPTPATSDDSTSAANTAFVNNVLQAAAVHGSKKIILGNVMIQWGDTDLDLAGTPLDTKTVTFTTAFAAVPTYIGLTVQTAEDNKLVAAVNSTDGSASTTQLHIAVKTGDGTNSAATPKVYWIVVGRV